MLGTYSLFRILSSSVKFAHRTSSFIKIPSKHVILLHFRNYNVNSFLNNSYFLNRFVQNSFLQLRMKSSKSKRSREYESEEDSDEETVAQIPGSKIIQVSSDSLRCDVILKLGLGIPRNKLDILFYEGRIRINGKKILKKSVDVSIDDELDIIKEPSSENPNFLQISRIEVLKARPTGNLILLTLRKQKSLIVDNYPESPWEEDSSQDITKSTLS